MSQASDELDQRQAIQTRLQQENQALATDKKSLTAHNLALAQLSFGEQTEKAAKGTFVEAEQHASVSPAHHKKGYVLVNCCRSAIFNSCVNYYQGDTHE